MSTAVVEPYNSVLSTHSLLEHTDVSVMLVGAGRARLRSGCGAGHIGCGQESMVLLLLLPL